MKFLEMTSTQLRSVERDQTVVVVPIAAVEQHGPHMPTGTDTLLSGAIAEALEVRLPDRILLAPTVWLGASAHHLRLGATLDAPLEHYIDTLMDISRSLLNDGYMRLLLLNGHGGNIDPMRVAVRRIQPEFPRALLAAGSYWCVADKLIREILAGDHQFVGHACEFETSLMLHLRPELVDQEALADAGPLVPDQLEGVFLSRDMRQRTQSGFTGRPDLASAVKGQQLFEGIVARLADVIDQLLRQPLGTEYQEFTA